MISSTSGGGDRHALFSLAQHHSSTQPQLSKSWGKRTLGVLLFQARMYGAARTYLKNKIQPPNNLTSKSKTKPRKKNPCSQLPSARATFLCPPFSYKSSEEFWFLVHLLLPSVSEPALTNLVLRCWCRHTVKTSAPSPIFFGLCSSPQLLPCGLHFFLLPISGGSFTLLRPTGWCAQAHGSPLSLMPKPLAFSLSVLATLLAKITQIYKLQNTWQK